MKSSMIKDFTWGNSIAFSPLITEATKSIKFSANVVSKAMDTAAGGVSKFAGYHRVHSGHSIVDVGMWKKYGLKFPKEIGIDSLTTNGVPLPGIETLVKKGYLSSSAATKWFSLNVGVAVCATLSIADTGLNVFRYKKKKLRVGEIGTAGKGLVKVGVGLATSNPFSIACGVIDLGIYSLNKLDSKLEFNIDYSCAAWI